MKKCEGIYSLIGKVNHKSAIYGFQLLKEENIHPRQMPLIIHLKKCEGCTQKELAEKMQVKPSTLNVMIGRMEKNGYITSFPGVGDNGGKKRTYYSITDAGREYYKARCEEWALTKEVVEQFIKKEN